MPPAARTRKLTTRLKRVLERMDVQAERHSRTLAGTRKALLRAGDIDMVVDVGAHAGEYGRGLRASGYTGKIVSFEPVRRQFERLVAASAGDSAWECQNRASGARSGTATINVSGNDGFSSSLLAMNSAHERAVSESRYESTEQIVIARLDEALATHDLSSHACYLKIDAQGYEHEVLGGAEKTLHCCRAVELELSLTVLYEGQLLIGETIDLVRGHGFQPTHLEPEFTDPQTGELLQVNGLFQRVVAGHGDR